MPIDAFLLDEIRVRPILSNAPLANHHEAIGVLHRALPTKPPYRAVTTHLISVKASSQQGSQVTSRQPI